MNNNRSFTQYFKDVCTNKIDGYNDKPEVLKEEEFPDMNFIEEYYDMSPEDREQLEIELRWQALEAS